MKHQDLTASSVAIQELLRDELFKEMTEWSNRIAKRAYELFAASGFTNGHDRDGSCCEEVSLCSSRIG